MQGSPLLPINMYVIRQSRDCSHFVKFLNVLLHLLHPRDILARWKEPRVTDWQGRSKNYLIFSSTGQGPKSLCHGSLSVVRPSVRRPSAPMIARGYLWGAPWVQERLVGWIPTCGVHPTIPHVQLTSLAIFTPEKLTCKNSPHNLRTRRRTTFLRPRSWNRLIFRPFPWFRIGNFRQVVLVPLGDYCLVCKIDNAGDQHIDACALWTSRELSASWKKALKGKNKNVLK